MAERGDTLRSLRQILTAPRTGGKGILQLVGIPSPASGGGLTRTVPGDYWERLIAVSFTFASSGTAGVRSLAFQVANGDGIPFISFPISGTIGVSQTITAYGYKTFNPGIAMEGAKSAYGTVTSPAAGSTIVSVGTFQPGLYQIEWEVELAGTVAAAVDGDNFKLTGSGAQIAQSTNVGAVGVYPQNTVNFEQTTVSTISLQNIALATVGAIYSGTVTVQALEVAGAPFALPDITCESGWQTNIAIGNAQVGDQLSNIQFLLERYASNYANGGYEDELDYVVRRALERELTESGQW